MSNGNLGDLTLRLTGDASRFVSMLTMAESRLVSSVGRMNRILEDSLDPHLSTMGDMFIGSTIRMANGLHALGANLTKFVTLPLVGLGAVAVTSFGNFDQAMTNAAATMRDVTEAEEKMMASLAKAISKHDIHSATELATAYKFLASAGLDADKAMRALPVVAKFATAGNFDLQKATSLLVSSQKAMELTSKDAAVDLQNLIRVGNVLTVADQEALGSVEQFAEALNNKLAGALRISGKSVEEGAAGLMAFAQRGVRGKMAGEQLSIVLRDFGNAIAKQPEVWQLLGLSVYDVNTKAMLPLSQLIGQLEEKFKGMSAEQVVATKHMLGFQQRSFFAIQTLLGMSQEIRDFETKVNHASFAMEEMSQKRTQTLNAQLTLLWNRFHVLAIELGERFVPMVEKVSGWLNEMTVWWEKLDEQQKTNVADTILLTATLGPLVLGLGAATTAFLGLLSVVMLVQVQPIVLFIEALGAAMILLALNTLVMIDIMDGWEGSFAEKFTTMIGTIRLFGNTIENWMAIGMLYWDKFWEHALFKVEMSMHAILQLVTRAVAEITRLLARASGNPILAAMGEAMALELETRASKMGVNRVLRYRAHDRSQARFDRSIQDLMKMGEQNSAVPIAEKELVTPHSQEGQGSNDVPPADLLPVMRGQFQETSLRRFDLNALAGMAPKKQEVSDKIVAQKLDEVIKLLGSKFNIRLG